MQRRAFLKLIGSTPLFAYCPQLLATPRKTDWRRTLLLVELTGGNDSLNTVIPYSEKTYYQMRPNLAIPRDQLLPLTEQTALHPALESLLPQWHKNQLAIVQGVGYAQPNLSHFRSLDIWQSGSGSHEYIDDGWVARYFSHLKRPDNLLADGIALGRDYGPLQGKNFQAITLLNAEQFIRQAEHQQRMAATSANPALRHLQQVQQTIQHSALHLQTQLIAKQQVPEFPNTAIGRQFETAARIILSDIRVPVLKLNHGSFDTHVGQLTTHQRLLSQLAEAIAVFINTVQAHNRWDDVLIMTYSEFGRRVAENGNRGTDHGTAASHFLLGGKLPGGIYGHAPSLQQLTEGNLQYHVDFRCVYRSAIDWLNLGSSQPFSAFKPAVPL